MRLTCFIGILALAASVAAPASAATSSPSRTQGLAELDAVDVRATKLYELRMAMNAVEEQFYARYNALNERREFDIRCHQVRRTGTLLDERECVPRIVENVRADEAQEVQDTIDRNEATEAQAPARPLAGRLILATYTPEYEANMRQIMRGDLKLRSLVKEWEKLQAKYEEVRRRKN